MYFVFKVMSRLSARPDWSNTPTRRQIVLSKQGKEIHPGHIGGLHECFSQTIHGHGDGYDTLICDRLELLNGVSTCKENMGLITMAHLTRDTSANQCNFVQASPMSCRIRQALESKATRIGDRCDLKAAVVKSSTQLFVENNMSRAEVSNLHDDEDISIQCIFAKQSKGTCD